MKKSIFLGFFMTEKLWLRDSYLKEFDAKVQKVSQGKFVVLDRTAFYPEQGGQSCDTGTIIRKNDKAEFKVVYGKAFGEDVSCETGREGLKEGDEVHCIIDWEKRYKLMRMHSSAHIVHNAIFSKLGVLVAGNQLGLEESRMDFAIQNFDRELLQGIESAANEIIAKNLNITIEFLPREEALKKPELFRLKDKLPKAVEEFRIVSIGNIDVSADGGTHVKNTKEIGSVKIVKMKNKGADNRRIYWKLTQIESQKEE